MTDVKRCTHLQDEPDRAVALRVVVEPRNPYPRFEPAAPVQLETELCPRCAGYIDGMLAGICSTRMRDAARGLR